MKRKTLKFGRGFRVAQGNRRTGRARIEGRNHLLRAGTPLLIEHRDRHEIRNTGRAPLETLNFYSPPAYRSNGSELPPAKP